MDQRREEREERLMNCVTPAIAAHDAEIEAGPAAATTCETGSPKLPDRRRRRGRRAPPGEVTENRFAAAWVWAFQRPPTNPELRRTLVTVAGFQMFIY